MVGGWGGRAYVHKRVEARGPRVSSSIALPHFLRQGLSPNLELASLARPISQPAPGIYLAKLGLQTRLAFYLGVKDLN